MSDLLKFGVNFWARPDVVDLQVICNLSGPTDTLVFTKASAIHLYLAEQALVRHLQSLLVICCRDWPMGFSSSQISASGQMAFAVPYHIRTIYEEVNKVFFATK